MNSTFPIIFSHLECFNWSKFFFITISGSMILAAILVNALEPYVPAFISRAFRYGKFASKADSWLIKNLEVPKSYFQHFYSFALKFSTLALILIVRVYYFNSEPFGWLRNLLDFFCGCNRVARVSTADVSISMVLLHIQIFRRYVDTHYVSIFSDKAKMNLTHYLIGMVYYPLIIFIILAEAPKFAAPSYDLKTHSNFLNVIVIAIFMYAWYHQRKCTVILANLRRNKEGRVISQGYKIPYGDWFELVSSPHSFAEILMYTCLTFFLYKNTTWWCVYLWVLVNQIETSILSHWWYQTNFKDYPRDRKIIIPFVY